MRSGADSEMTSGLGGSQVDLIKQAPGIRRDGQTPLASAELYVIIDLPRRSGNTPSNVPMRGIQPTAFAVREEVTLIEGRSAADLRSAVARRDTAWEGAAYTWQGQVHMFAQQQRKNARAIADEVRGKLRRDGTGRDLGYPGGRIRPVRFDRAAAGLPEDEPA
jgi:hypothetical protein